MVEEKTHSAIVLKSRQYIIFINSYIILGMVLTGLLTEHFHIIAILWAGSILFLLLPIVAKRYFMNRFSRLTTFQFTKDSIYVSSVSEQQKMDSCIEIKVQDIISYKYENGSGNPYLILYFKSGEKKSFNFQPGTTGEEYIIDIILKYIRDQNFQRDQNSVITMKPNFMATRGGLIFITVLGIGWIVICIILVATHSKATPFSLIGGIAMFIQTIILRNNSLKSYKEQNKDLSRP